MMRPRKPDIEATQREKLRNLQKPHEDDGYDPDEAHCSKSQGPIRYVVQPRGECTDNDNDVDELNSTTSANAQQQVTFEYPSTSTTPPAHVPNPQIQSDSKKTSSPRRYRYSAFLHRRIFEITLLIHLFSLFACVTSNHYANKSVPKTLQDLCKNYTKYQPEGEKMYEQCRVFEASIIPELCSAGTPFRIRLIHEVFLLADDTPLSLFDLFSVGRKDGDKWQLQSGEKGIDCISGNSKRCTNCFKRLSAKLDRLETAFQSFDATLSRFDCLPALDTNSATRPFSPNATCKNCKLWYRQWLLVQTLQVWQRVPCINWCYYTQLACPHLAPAKLWDYAGHPSFQCRDMDIDSWRQECECIHPCDINGVKIPGVIGNAPSFRHDFFAAQVHCETRKRECRARSTAHDRMSTTSIIPTIPPLSTNTQQTSGVRASWTVPRLFNYILFLLLWML